MVSVSEKDGATIIVIENPSLAEKSFIQKAKNMQAIDDNVWSRFKCNQKNNSNSASDNNKEIPFEEITSSNNNTEIPFEEL